MQLSGGIGIILGYPFFFACWLNLRACHIGGTCVVEGEQEREANRLGLREGSNRAPSGPELLAEILEDA
jgi:hypothetical protein